MFSKEAKQCIGESILDFFVILRMEINLDGSATIGPERDAVLFKALLDTGMVAGGALRNAVHEALCMRGREIFALCITEPKTPVDHSPCPMVLGYAIRHGALSPEEINGLHFDMGDTPERYVAQAESLLEKIVSQLYTGTAYEKKLDLSNTCPCEGC